MSITVLLAAPSCQAQARLCDALRCDPSVHVVAQTATRWAAGEVLRRCEPEAAVVDAALLSTREFFLQGWGPISRATCIVAVGPVDPGLARRLTAMGAADYVRWDELGDRLAPAVRSACAERTASSGRFGVSARSV